MHRERRRRLLAGLALILAWLPPAPAETPREIPPARDFAADALHARARRIPILVLYSQADCHWCEQVRREHLRPLLAAPEKVLLRQVDLDQDRPLLDFDGKHTTHRAFARHHGAKVTPTLAVFGPDGRQPVEPLVGVRIPDYYGAYIERLIERADARLYR